jgi:hypothetical protein
MENYYTENLAGFGYRERDLASDLLKASLPDNFYDQGVKVAFNAMSGYVFLTNDDYQVAMFNGDKLALWHSTPYSGLEGFIDELISENEPNDINSEDADYIIEAAQNELVELPASWYSYWLFKTQKERAIK